MSVCLPAYWICKGGSVTVWCPCVVYEEWTLRLIISQYINLRNPFKGQCHEIFCFWFFSWISFPPAPEYPNRTFSNFFENSRRYSQVKVHRRYQRTGGASWAANIYANFRKNSKRPWYNIIRGLVETDPWRKPEVGKSRGTVPLKYVVQGRQPFQHSSSILFVLTAPRASI